MKVTAIVPSYKPDEKLAGVLRDLAAAGFERIIVVDDGSGPEYEAYFREAEGYPQCVLLRHEVNRGKGGALKTAFAWFLEHTGEDLGVVTVDGDGQHTAADALRCARELEAHPDSLVLGVRQFDGADVPLRSRIGNQATIWCFRVLCGVGVSDTQTGLRAIGTDFLRALCTVPGDRYEFETNMLLATSAWAFPSGKCLSAPSIWNRTPPPISIPPGFPCHLPADLPLSLGEPWLYRAGCGALRSDGLAPAGLLRRAAAAGRHGDRPGLLLPVQLRRQPHPRL